MLKANEGASQEFKRYTWPINTKTIIHHIKKTIVGFLNVKGGVIYIGINEDSNKMATVTGISLNFNQIKEIFEFFSNDIVE